MSGYYEAEKIVKENKGSVIRTVSYEASEFVQCPYCLFRYDGYTEHENIQMEDGSIFREREYEIKCPECGNIFMARKVVEVSYWSKKKER